MTPMSNFSLLEGTKDPLKVRQEGLLKFSAQGDQFSPHHSLMTLPDYAFTKVFCCILLKIMVENFCNR